MTLCNGRIKISKSLMRLLEKTEPSDACFAYAKHKCEKCGKLFCKNHLNKHRCELHAKI